MANYDGSILINTKINVKNAEVQLSALENKMVKAADKVASLKTKMEALKETQVPTEGYAKLQTDLEKAQAELSALVEKQEQFSQMGVTSGAGWDALNEQIATASDRIDAIKAKMYEMEQAGNAFVPGGTENTAEYAELARQLQYAENELRLLNEQHDLHEMKLKKAQDAYRRVGDAAKKGLSRANNEIKKSQGFVEKFFRRVKGLAERVFIFSFVTKFFRGIVNGIKSGFSNFYNYSESFKNSVDGLKASLSTLSNSFAAAFAPLVEVAIPYIQKLIDYIIRLLGLFAQFTALITGQKTYTRAIKQTAAATKEASKAAEGYLSPLDEINKFQKKDTGEEDAVDPKTMFEEVPINSKLLDFFDKIAGYLGKLKDIFMKGFWDGLGDWQYRWESIKNSIASIKESLKDIFTDPAVLAAADKWAQSVAYMLGSLAGSMASIGLTIAANLLGGIAMYLEGNKDRIKGYLVSMFDIWTEINYLLANLFQSIAYVFEAFASENGQRLTANLIGIFADAFMGVTELASKIGRDVLNIFIQPFVENRDAFRTALEGFLGVLADVAGTIKDSIDATFDKLNEVYDAHFKPFFDSVAQGLSDLVGEFMAFWNESVQPILDQMAADFDELWKTHIQPLINSVIEFLGKVADLLKAVWETILKPFISWFIQNVLPVVLPVIQAIWDMLTEFVGYVADVASSIIKVLGGIIDFLTGVLTGDWEKAFDGLKNIFDGFLEVIQNTLEGFFTLIKNIVNVFFELIKSVFSIFVDAILDAVSSFLDFLKSIFIDGFDEIKERFLEFLDSAEEKWNDTWDAVGDKIKEVVDGIKKTIKSAFEWITDKIDSLKEKLTSIKGKASSLFGRSSSSGSKSTGRSASSPSSRSYSMSYGPTLSSPVPQALASLATKEFPGYATGTVIPRTMQKHLAWLGDNNQETEVVSPISTMKQAVTEAITELGGIGGNRYDVKAYAKGRVLLELIIEEGKAMQQSTGDNPFLLK